MKAEDPRQWTPTENYDPYVYRTQVKSVTDGDTLKVRLDTGFHTYHHAPVRLLDVDTREIFFVDKDTEEYRRGIAHKEFTEAWIQQRRDDWSGDWPFYFKTNLKGERGKYGRVLAFVYARSDGARLGEALKREFDDVHVYKA